MAAAAASSSATLAASTSTAVTASPQALLLVPPIPTPEPSSTNGAGSAGIGAIAAAVALATVGAVRGIRGSPGAPSASASSLRTGGFEAVGAPTAMCSEASMFRCASVSSAVSCARRSSMTFLACPRRAYDWIVSAAACWVCASSCRLVAAIRMVWRMLARQPFAYVSSCGSPARTSSCSLATAPSSCMSSTYSISVHVFCTAPRA